MYVLCDALEKTASTEFFSWRTDENWSWIKYLAELKIKVETDDMDVMLSVEQSLYFCVYMW